MRSRAHAGSGTERTRTGREAIREELLQGAATGREISERVSIRREELPGHLEHLEKSLRARGERLVVQPASCIACGYAFVRRARLRRPGSRPASRAAPL